MSESELIKLEWEEFDEMCRINFPKTEQDVREKPYLYPKSVSEICYFVLFSVCGFVLIAIPFEDWNLMN